MPIYMTQIHQCVKFEVSMTNGVVTVGINKITKQDITNQNEAKSKPK